VCENLRFESPIVLNAGGRLNGCNGGHDGRPESRHKRTDEMMALKKQGVGHGQRPLAQRRN